MHPQLKEQLPEIKSLFRKHGAESAYVFGSAATGSASENSDFDFLFSFPKTMHYEDYGDNYFKLLFSLQDLLQRDVDLVAEKTIVNPYLREKINSQKIRLI